MRIGSGWWVSLATVTLLSTACADGAGATDQSESQVVGKSCGGLAGAQCGDGEFCELAVEAACGSADQRGECKEVPTFCTADIDPVCGCDGKTYSNPCDAAASGVSVRSHGACEGGEGGAAAGADCGGFVGTACAAGLFCNFGEDAACGFADMTGTCEARPEACTEEVAPVCGCDGKTYSNACQAMAAGVSVQKSSACSGG